MADSSATPGIVPYLKLAVEKQASDLFFTTNSPVMIKINGEMHSVGKTELTSAQIRELANGILTPEQREEVSTYGLKIGKADYMAHLMPKIMS